MKIKVSTPMLSLKGEPIHRGKSDEKVTIREILVDAFLGETKEDNIDGAERFKRFNLAMKINNPEIDEVELTAEEITLAKSLIPKVYPDTYVTGYAYKILENTQVPENTPAAKESQEINESLENTQTTNVQA